MKTPTTAPSVPFTIVISTVYGQMLINRNDVNQANALINTGRGIDHDEIALLSSLIKVRGTNLTAIDVGANFGTYSLALASAVGPKGRVHAFEPQRVIFNMLAGSVALNSLTNVYCYNAAVGDREDKIEIPQFDYSKPLNFGSIEFGPEQREPLAQARRHDRSRVELVPLTTIDRFAFKQVDLIKIDAEGMEMQVLDGARETIGRCRPILYIEYLKVDRNALRRRVIDHGYAVHPNNINYLCIPSELSGKVVVNRVTKRR